MLIQQLFGRCLLIVYVLICAWMDYKEQSIDIRVFISMGICEVIWCIGAIGFHAAPDMISMLCGVMIGAALYVASFITKGSIGDGDAIFFGLTGIAMGGRYNLMFFGLTIIMTSVWALGYSAYGFINKINVRNKTMPLIPFALPAGAMVLAML